MARTEDIEIKREVAAAFCSLSSVQDNKVEIADRALSTIITLSLSGDDEVEKQAISTVANLVEMVELHDKLLGAFGFMFLDLCCCYVFEEGESGSGSLVSTSLLFFVFYPLTFYFLLFTSCTFFFFFFFFAEEDGLAPLIALAMGNDLNTKGEACRALANLAANRDVQQQIMTQGGLRPMVNGVRNNNIACQRFGALGIGNLATNVANQVRIVQEGAIQPLVQLSGDMAADTEARRYSVLALANLAATIGNHPAILEEKALFSLFTLRYVFVVVDGGGRWWWSMVVCCSFFLSPLFRWTHFVLSLPFSLFPSLSSLSSLPPSSLPQ
jgi:hypothetical protein